MARLTVGGLLLLAVGVVLLATRRWSALVAFVAGSASAVIAAALYLGFNGALDDWWVQAILVPLRWHNDTIGAGGEVHVRDRLTHVAVPGLVLAAVTAWFVVVVLERARGRAWRGIATRRAPHSRAQSRSHSHGRTSRFRSGTAPPPSGCSRSPALS